MTIAKKKSKVDTKSMDETGRRSPGDERRMAPQEVSVERRKVQRRRQIDPTTCERDYTNDEIDFMKAMDQYKRENRRPFPTWSEVLEVVHSFYRQRRPLLVPKQTTSARPRQSYVQKRESDEESSSLKMRKGIQMGLAML